MSTLVRWCALAAAALCGVSSASAQAASGVPALRDQGTARQLIVDGAPFLILGGELGNSTGSSNVEMAPVWAKLRALHLNTVVAPVYWELIEPSEGRFEFASVDSLVADARTHGMRLVLLWFGSWKNSMSSYAPAYVKTDQRRFPRTESTRGTGQEILSPFSRANMDADARAFRALMKHLRTIDGTRHTVLMVQVENEIGMIPTARDHSALADSLFAQPVPREVRGGRPAGTWAELFSPLSAAEEMFMAWHFARYAQAVAAAGKAEYPLPMYANAALIRPGYVPGQYVSAGPLPHLMEVWRAAAPAIDFLAPDIYFPNFVEWTAKYARPGNPLFIPENGSSAQSAVNAFHAIGAHDAIGYSPFAIESLDTTRVPLAKSYALLAELAPVILEHQGRGTMAGLMPTIAFDGTVTDTVQQVGLGEFQLTVSFQRAPDGSRTGGGLVVALSPNEYLIAGSGMTITFQPIGAGDPIAGILRAQEGHYRQGRWIGGRWLNGDQTHQGRHIRLEANTFTVQRVTLYRYH